MSDVSSSSHSVIIGHCNVKISAIVSITITIVASLNNHNFHTIKRGVSKTANWFGFNLGRKMHKWFSASFQSLWLCYHVCLTLKWGVSKTANWFGFNLGWKTHKQFSASFQSLWLWLIKCYHVCLTSLSIWYIPNNTRCIPWVQRWHVGLDIWNPSNVSNARCRRGWCSCHSAVTGSSPDLTDILLQKSADLSSGSTKLAWPMHLWLHYICWLCMKNNR